MKIGARSFRPAGYRDRPAISVRSLYNVFPAVTYSVFMSGPPKALLVMKSSGIGMNFSSAPATNFYSNRDPGAMPEPTPVPAGTYAAAAVVLLTDGENNEEPDPLEAAQVAADRGIRIHTVGIGNAAGVTLETEGFRVHTRLDEAMLQTIAERTDGRYYGAETHGELAAVYESLDTRLVVRPESIEITAIFIGAGIIILLLGAVSSLLWLGRLS